MAPKITRRQFLIDVAYSVGRSAAAGGLVWVSASCGPTKKPATAQEQYDAYDHIRKERLSPVPSRPADLLPFPINIGVNEPLEVVPGRYYVSINNPNIPGLTMGFSPSGFTQIMTAIGLEQSFQAHYHTGTIDETPEISWRSDLNRFLAHVPFIGSLTETVWPLYPEATSLEYFDDIQDDMIGQWNARLQTMLAHEVIHAKTDFIPATGGNYRIKPDLDRVYSETNAAAWEKDGLRYTPVFWVDTITGGKISDCAQLQHRWGIYSGQESP